MNAIAPMPTHNCATHNCAEKEKKENKNCCHSEKKTCEKNNKNSDTENSNSRCNCGCCAVISIVVTYSQVNVAYLYLEKNNFLYKEEKYNNSPNHIWNPPKYN